MKRLLKSVRGDIFLQMKYGIYLIYGIITLVYVVLLRQLSINIIDTAVPLVVLTDPSMLGFFFIGGLVLFEKGEGTLEYLVVSPLSINYYLISKMLSLTLVSTIVGLLVAMLTYGDKINILLLLIGIILTSFLFILIGFIAVVPFNTVNKYMLSSILYVTFLFSPFIDYFGMYRSWLFYLIPTQASILLIFGSFKELELWSSIYSISYLIIWILIAYKIAHKRFIGYIILKSKIN